MPIRFKQVFDFKKWSLKKIFINFLKLSLGGLAVYIIIQKVDIGQVGQYIKEAEWLFLILSALAFFISKVIAAFRVNCYYRTLKLNLSEYLNAKLTLLSMFYSLFIPMIGGEGFKVYWLHQKYKSPIKSLVWASLLDRVSGLAALVMLALIIFQLTMIDLPYKQLLLLGIPILYGLYYFIHKLAFRTFHLAWWKVNGYSILV